MAEQTSFQTILDALQDTKKEFPKRYLQQFSDIDPLELKTLLDIWPRLPLTRKLVLLDGLLTLMDSDTLVSFEDIGRALIQLNDPDAEVRARAIRLLAETNDAKLVKPLIQILRDDPDLAPRMEAATLLGEFVLLGELEELPENLHRDVENALMAIVSGDENISLRKLALEAVGYSARAEVETLIQSAFNRSDPTWVASALVAMGRSSDEQWAEQVLSMLPNADPRIRLAAMQAAGELSIDAARPIILSMLLEGEEDEDDVIAAGIWSLSKIGGEDVRAFLVNMMDQTEDEDLTAYLEEALMNLDYTEEFENFDLLNLDEDDLDLDEDDLVEEEDEE
ncbi:MAG: HEAT repeat domain-containing protein [Anaerolineales bacterium]